MTDVENLINRLRERRQPWPAYFAADPLCQEAADAIEMLLTESTTFRSPHTKDAT